MFFSKKLYVFNNNNNNNNNERISTLMVIHVATPMGAIHITTLVVIHIILEIWIANNVAQSNNVILWAQLI